MSNDKPATALVRISETSPIDPARLAHHVHLHPDDAIPRRPVELVTEEEKRQEAQAKHRAELPHDFFKRAPRIDPPLALGAVVNCESFLGFLAAIEKILPPDVNYPILSSAKIWYEPTTSMLYLEAGSHAVWTAVALKVTSGSPKGFTAMMPVQRAKNILMAIRDLYPAVTVGVDDQGVCLGPHTVPFGGLIDDFPVQPIISEWVARAAMPAFYFREICSRVLLAKSAEFKDIALQGALLDFELHELDGHQKVLCTAVAMDGARIHILRLPQMVIEVTPTRLRALPPTVTVSAGLFHYMQEIVQHEWAAVEFSNDQIAIKADDFIVVAKASPEGRSSLNELASWRKVNAEWPGYWLAPSVKLVQIVRSSSLNGTTEECRLRIDGMKELLTISSSNAAGDNYSQSISVRGFDGPSIVDVQLSIPFLTDALTACIGGLVRLAFAHDTKDQATSPVVIRGEDEQFKAIIMPRTEEPK